MHGVYASVCTAVVVLPLVVRVPSRGEVHVRRTQKNVLKCSVGIQRCPADHLSGFQKVNILYVGMHGRHHVVLMKIITFPVNYILQHEIEVVNV